MRLKLISTYSAVGDSYEERKADPEAYEEYVMGLSDADLLKHYNEVFV